MKKIIYLLLLACILPSFIFAQKTKKIVSETSDGSLKRVYNVQSKNPIIKHGSYIEYYNKNKTKEGEYIDDKKDGEWLFYTPKKKLQIKAQYTNGVKTGKWVFFYLNTDIVQSEIFYRNNKIDSTFTYYMSNQLKRAEKHFSDGSGIETTYYEDGGIYEIIKIGNGESSSLKQLFFQNGQLHREIIYYKSTPLTAITCFNNKGENIDGGSLENGTGELITYHLPIDKSQNQLKVKSYENYKDTLLNGISRYISEKGFTKERREYVQGEKKGLWEFFDETGAYKYETYYSFSEDSSEPFSDFYIDYSKQLISKPFFPGNEYYRVEKTKKGKFKNNKRNGEWSYYSDNGSLIYNGMYVDGKRVGKWNYYFKNSKKVSTEIYYTENKIDSVFSYYFMNRKIRYELKNFSDGTGTVHSFYKNGNQHEVIPRKNGFIEGITEIYFINGQLHRTTIYSNSKPKTVVNCYNQKGEEIFGGDLLNGNGEFAFYYLPLKNNINDLKPKSLEMYKDHKLNGLATYLWENGNLEKTGYYNDNKKYENWQYYNTKGQTSYNQNFSVTEPDQDNDNESVLSSLQVTVMPSFPGGENKMYQFIGKNIQYPHAALENGISGRVFVSFVVLETGEIADIRIIRGIGSGCDLEVYRIMSQIPKWNPGLQNGTPVNVYYKMPIKFTQR